MISDSHQSTTGCPCRWAAWEEAQPRLRHLAAIAIQSFARRKTEYKCFRVAVREALVRRQMAEMAASTLQVTLAHPLSLIPSLASAPTPRP